MRLKQIIPLTLFQSVGAPGRVRSSCAAPPGSISRAQINGHRSNYPIYMRIASAMGRGDIRHAQASPAPADDAHSERRRTDSRMPPVIRHAFYDRERRLRNGWWMLLFVALFIASHLIYTPISHGLQGLGVGKEWLEPLGLPFTLLVTWICGRLR